MNVFSVSLALSTYFWLKMCRKEKRSTEVVVIFVNVYVCVSVSMCQWERECSLRKIRSAKNNQACENKLFFTESSWNNWRWWSWIIWKQRWQRHLSYVSYWSPLKTSMCEYINSYQVEVHLAIKKILLRQGEKCLFIYHVCKVYEI